jgi:hypothetical protein
MLLNRVKVVRPMKTYPLARIRTFLEITNVIYSG